MEDIVPKLLNKIQNDFQKKYDKDSEIAELVKKLEAGTAKHEHAYAYANKVGSILADTYSNDLSSTVLPEGKMWYNIGNRIITPTMEKNYSYISEYVNELQKQLNEAAGIGIKSINVPVNADRIRGIINRLSSEDDFDKVAWILKEPIKTAAKSVVDDSIKANAEFHGKSGMTPKIVRKTSGKCCKWCTEIAGVYNYPDVPDDIYRRHENCDCVVEYDPGNGKRQNVHTKQWRDESENDRIKKRKSIVVDSDKDDRKTEYRRHVGENGLSYDESVAITDYMSSSAYVINEKIRQGIELTNAEKKFCKDLDSALKKIPTYEGNLSRSLFFYSDSDIEAFVNGFEINKNIHFPEYISTTKGTGLYNPEGQVQIYIQNSSKGHDVTGFNHMENEVLYDKGSKFMVKNKVKHEGKWFILLEEA